MMKIIAKMSQKIGINIESLKKALMDSIKTFILFLSALLACVGLSFYFFENKKTAKKLAVIGIIIIITIFGLDLYNSVQQDEAESARSVSGTISSNLNNIIYPCICLGHGTICNTSNAVQIINDPMFVQIKDGQLRVSAIVRDESGKIMGDIEDNVFEAIPPYAPRSRHDDNGWEVLDPYGRVALQIDLIDSCAHIEGCFYSEDGRYAIVFPSTNSGLGNVSFINFGGTNIQIKENITQLWMKYPNIITPIFDYRSDKYGERIKK